MKTLIPSLMAIVFAVFLISCTDQDSATNPGPDDGSALAISKKSNNPNSPTITSISRASAEIGDALTINGTNFGASKASNSHVTIKGINATVYTSWANTQITVLVPSGTTAGMGTVVVTIQPNKTTNAVSFELLPCTDVTISGIYGTQVWMGYNLDVDHYADNTVIPEVTDPTAWNSLTTGAWCYYNNDPAIGALYGRIYNGYAVSDGRGLAPEGYHIPTEAEWKTLFMNLGMSQTEADGYGYPPNAYYGTDEGGMLKEQGTSLWNGSNVGATNSSGFTALPGGYRNINGVFEGIRGAAGWWSATEFTPDPTRLWMRMVVNYYANTYHNNLVKHDGFSVRCIKNSN
jgi:uncharacterized protein (TIGR02145 family)